MLDHICSVFACSAARSATARQHERFAQGLLVGVLLYWASQLN